MYGSTANFHCSFAVSHVSPLFNVSMIYLIQRMRETLKMFCATIFKAVHDNTSNFLQDSGCVSHMDHDVNNDCLHTMNEQTLSRDFELFIVQCARYVGNANETPLIFSLMEFSIENMVSSMHVTIFCSHRLPSCYESRSSTLRWTKVCI